MMSLNQFQEKSPVEIFKNAKTLPSFFETNLVDPARVVKVFENDPQANIKVFYYQYLKLCFEVQAVDYQLYIKKIEELINNQTFKFIFFEDDDPTVYNDLQFKRLISEFFGVLSEATISIEDALSLHPIMDTVFVYFFRTLLILTGRTDAIDSYIDRDELFDFLAGYFQVEVSVHNKCWKFSETDIFVYEEDPRQVFMAFMDYEQESPSIPQYRESASIHSSHQASQTQIAPPPQPAPQQSQPSNLIPPRQTSVINQSYIASEFVDYTDTRNAPGKGLSSLLKSDLKNSNTLNEENKGFQNFNQIMNSEKAVSKQSKKEDNFSKIIQKETAARVTTPINRIEEDYKYQSSKIQNVQPTSANYPINLGKNDYTAQDKFNYLYEDKRNVPQTKTQAWQPTKDPGFQSNYLKDIVGPLNNGSKYLNPNIPVANTSYEFQVSKINDSYAKSSYDASYQKPAINNYSNDFTSSLSSAYQKPAQVYQKPKPTQTFDYKSSDFDYKKPLTSYDTVQPSYLDYNKKPNSFDAQANYTASVSIPTKRNPFGLNVSQQFTNSQTLKSVVEPCRSNILNIVVRARAFRNSLNSYMK